MQPEWEALQAEVRDLAARVARLEEVTGVARVAVVQPAAAPRVRTPLPVAAFGKAMLGLAGAYLLRALTEGGALPHRAGIAAGLLYAIGWMVAAARTPARRRVETALHSLTGALVLSPLLWEATLRFHAINTWTAGGILLFFTVFGLAVSWRKNILILATIATLAGLGTSAALLIASYDVLPFTFVLLAIAAAVEVSACLDHWLSERWLAACAADLSVLLATWLVTREYGLPPDYAAIPHSSLLLAQVSLLAIYLSQHHHSHAAARLHLHLVRNRAVRAGVWSSRWVAACGSRRKIRAWRRWWVTISLGCAAACYVVSFAHAGPRRCSQPQFPLLLHLRHPAGPGRSAHPAFGRRRGAGLVGAGAGVPGSREFSTPIHSAGPWRHLSAPWAGRIGCAGTGGTHASGIGHAAGARPG